MTTAFDSWVQRARDVPIERVIEQRGIIPKGNGTEWSGPCPRCGGDDRFAINIAKQLFNCRGCDVGGDVIRLVEHLDSVDFIVACTTLTGEPPPKPNGKDHVGGPRKIVAKEFSYLDQDGAVVFAVERLESQNADGSYVVTKDGKRKKTFRQRRPDPYKAGSWIWNVDSVPVIPYRLPELLEAVAAKHIILIVEGEAKVDLLQSMNVPATCCAGGAKKWRTEHTEYLRGADIVLVPDNDDAGWEHINQIGVALSGIAARIRVLALPGLPLKGDIVDWREAGGTREQIDVLIEQASEWQPPLAVPTEQNKTRATADEQALIDELAKLNAPDYDRRRIEAAGLLGIRSGTLDDEVDARRAQQAEEAGAAPLYGYWVVEPWPEVVDTAALLHSLVARIKQNVILGDDAALAVALWILFAWVHETAVHSPILLVSSAEANSGKTALLSLANFLLPRSLMCVETSEATLFRGIELWQPTIIVDEADVILINNEPLRSVINSGWTRGSCVPRCIGDDNIPHAFPTFCPKALGMKGRKLPDTTLSRCIIIEMQRKKATEKVEHFRCVDDAALAQLRRRAMRWASDNGEKLKDAEPVMPNGFDNRLGDNWHLLLAIAETAGDTMAKQARKAASKLSQVADVASIGTQLLADIKAIYDEVGVVERMSSAELTAKLTADLESPWAEWKGGKPITQAQLARVLKPFGIRPGGFRLPSGGTPRGYQRSQFEDAWERYL